MDNRALAEQLRLRADELRANLPHMAPEEAGAARATLQWLSDLLLAIQTGDEGAKDELLRQGEAASGILHGRTDHLN